VATSRLACIGIAALLALPAAAQEVPIYGSLDRVHPVWAPNGMVASQEGIATRIGVEVLEAGGNAVDAAVAVGFALAVTLPRAGNLGGGGFMIVHQAESGETVAIDYRETAPGAAHRDMYLAADGEPDPQLSRFSHLAAGVPGTVAGMALALERYGTMSLADALAPAIRLAEQGFPVSVDLAESLRGLEQRMRAWPATEAIFYKGEGFHAPGEVFVQEDLARTLRLIAEEGTAAFYEGEIADLIVAEMERHGGMITHEDLAAYEALVREPVRGTYRGHEIASMPPPSSGGIHLVQILNILEDYPITEMGALGADTIHHMAEAMKLAFADRAEYLGDLDFVDVPVDGLVSKDYAAEQRELIDPLRATPAETIKPGDPFRYESPDTTHYSVVDEDGNAVSNTYTINFSYGSGIVVEGAGFLLNNEMDDFAAKPGEPNAYGLVQGERNAVEAGKRPLSSMTPTIVLRDGRPFLVTGSPGGPRIITTTLQVVMNVIDHGMNVAEATVAPRVHHQWLPDQLRVETGLSPDTIRILAERGHDVSVQDAMGSTQSILVGDGFLLGSSDPRRPDALTAGH
jgi:gamma-glutamyltranspeptidase / glutathione hydrolase